MEEKEMGEQIEKLLNELFDFNEKIDERVETLEEAMLIEQEK